MTGSPSLKTRQVRITTGKHAGRQGIVLETFPKDAVRPHPTAMICLSSGGIVAGVPVKDLEVCK